MNHTYPQSREQKQEYWQEHIAAWDQSLLTQKEYCRTNGLSLSSFSYWRNKLNKQSGDQTQFYPLTLQAQDTPHITHEETDSLHLFVNDKRFCLAIDKGFNEQVLGRLILMLEAM